MLGGSSAEQGGPSVGADPACGLVVHWLRCLLTWVEEMYRIWLVDAGRSREVEV